MIRARLADYRLFPYERDLAAREVRALTGASVKAEGDELIISATDSFQDLTERATYLSTVTERGEPRVTRQRRVEDLHWSLRSGRTRTKQATRYGLHGVHEYRGKFNPQMARALVNVVDHEATSLLDPFCGSGTTLLEGARLGLTVSGIDRSPMAHFLAATKLQAGTCLEAADLLRDFRSSATNVRDALKIGQEDVRPRAPDWISTVSSQYLAEWFTEPALSALYAAFSEIDQPGTAVVPDLVAVALSSIVRSVSLQLPEDLRVRRRPQGYIAPPLAELFDVAATRIELALEELMEYPAAGVGTGDVRVGSCASTDVVKACPTGDGRRLIVTSPPYATALPYIDTDRLSMILLGLVQPNELRAAEASLVGSREWLRGEASRWAADRADNTAQLPSSVLSLIESIEDQNSRLGAGFRRAAVPTLLYRYFADMGDCLDAWRAYLRPGEHAVLVVGRNRTGAKGHEIAIDTPGLLGAVAESRGYELTDLIAFETWPRYGLHGANGVRGEDAVLLARTP